MSSSARHALVFIMVTCGFLTLYCSSKKIIQLKPEQLLPQKTVSLSNANIKAVFVDNSAYGEVHRAGYNGISELSHTAQDSFIFVPNYAGFNLEHVFGGDSLVQLFEPRKHPMQLYQISDTEILLYQSPTPLSQVESQTIFKLVDPHYIDVTFRCVFHSKDFFKHDYAGFFWASYINKPQDKKIYFRGRDKQSSIYEWISAFSEKHGLKSTHLWEKDNQNIFFQSNFNATLASHFSDYVYQYPFYYGRFHNMVLAYFFDRSKGIRFSQSPTGGGATNPAWDFQYIIPDVKVGQEYSFHARIVYKEFKNREDILNEYQTWDKNRNK